VIDIDVIDLDVTDSVLALKHDHWGGAVSVGRYRSVCITSGSASRQARQPRSTPTVPAASRSDAAFIRAHTNV
jgi:hypothetical protein